MNEIMKKHDYDIQIVQGQVIFSDYENILKEAENLAEHVNQVTVNDENLRESKKLVSTMNKRVTEMNDKRKEVKNEILKPYTEYEQQVKHIESVVRNAENHVRTQVRDLAEQEREDKRQEIVNIFDMRIQHYDFESIMGFGDFIENKHLNKSYSISKVEQDLVQWLEMVRRDLAMIDRHTAKNPEDRDELIVEYQNTQNISVSFDNMDRRKEQMKQASEQAKQRELQAKRDARKQDEQEQQDALYTITVGERDLNLVKEFLKRNDIDNTVRKVK